MTIFSFFFDKISPKKVPYGQNYDNLFQLTPDNSRYSLSRYGLPDIPGCPSILINLKGYDTTHGDATYVFFCRNNTQLFDRLQAKIKQVQQNKSFRPVSIRTTPIPTPNPVVQITPTTQNQFFGQEPTFNSLNRASTSSTSNDHNYYNDPARDEQTRLLVRVDYQFSV